jgi:hypothetical protein
MSAQEHWKRSGLVDDLNTAIRDNPLAAGLITAGALWMLFGRKGIGAAAAGIGSAAVGAGHMAGRAGSAAFGSARSAAETAAHAIGSAGSSVAATVTDAGARGIDKVASIIPDLSADEPSDYGFTPEQIRARSSNSFASSATGRYAADMKSRLAETFEQQPLLLGAVGLAIGAAIASSFKTTKVESEWIGEQGAAARDKLTQTAKDVSERAWQAGKDEAQKQNLTEAAGWDAAEQLAEKAGSVLKAGRDSVQGAVRQS